MEHLVRADLSKEQKTDLLAWRKQKRANRRFKENTMDAKSKSDFSSTNRKINKDGSA